MLCLDHASTRTVATQGTSILYYFSPQHTEVVTKRNFYGCGSPRAHPTVHPGRAARAAGSLSFLRQWQPPPYKAHLLPAAQRMLGPLLGLHPGGAGKPLVVVHNKYTSEWNGPPINYISGPALKSLFGLLKSHYQVACGAQL